MKKIFFLMVLLGLGVQNTAMADRLHSDIVIPTMSPSEVSIPKRLVIEQNDIINPELQSKNKDKTQKNIYSTTEGNIYHPMMDLLGKYKNEIRVVYTDIDGIIIPENYKTTFFRDGIYKSVKNLKENNIPIIFTTGRTYREAKRVAEALDIEPLYYITQNGAEIVNSNDEVIYSKPIDRTHVFEISEEVKWFNYHYKQNLMLAYYDSGKVYVKRNSKIPNLVDIPVPIDYFVELPAKTPVSKIRIYGKDVNTLGLFKRYLARTYMLSLNINDVSNNFIDVNNKKATKEDAVSYVSNLIGIDLSNSAGFGYSQTDVGLMNLLRKNGGLAISNEKSLQEVKDASSYITKDVNSDGFTFAIDTILGNNLILKSE